MNEQKYTYRVQWLVFIGAALLLLLLVGAWISEGTNKEWRKTQKEFRKLLVEKTDPELRGGLDEVERGIFQVELPHFNRIDRCISCHHGLEDQRMSDLPQPHRQHPGNFLSNHPVQEYGCTICHGGQGRALSKDEAFGQLPETHWSYPLLEQPYIQASCGKCHLAIFDAEEGEKSEVLQGMDVFLRGKTIFSEEGCLGCHQARGIGGILGPDLTEQGEKTSHEYSFQNIRGEQSISNWLKEHFKDPEMVSPGSQMLRVNLEEKELDALATFVMGLAKPDIPFDYFSMATLNEFKGVREPMKAEGAFARLCSACHGKEGEGKSYKEYETGIPSIGNSDFARVASRDYIRFTLEKGRSLRQMGSWEEDISGLRSMELDRISVFLNQNGRKNVVDLPDLRRGSASVGQQLYEQYCQTCHGMDGKGEVAVALNQEGLLSRANSEFLYLTMALGRGNTAMPAWPMLKDQALVDLVVYLRSWSNSLPSGASQYMPEANLEEGGLKYHFLCSRCHGEFGEGETGPAIINEDFLEVASDAYLYETIARGREHTAMFGWATDVYNKEQLQVQDISNIIGFMRKSAGLPLNYVYAGSNPGQSDLGADLFAKHCVECHGERGEGVKGPALNNQEFLSAASNGFLMATITLGREGTVMPSWGYGQENYPKLSGKERQDLVAHLRSMQRIRIKY